MPTPATISIRDSSINYSVYLVTSSEYPQGEYGNDALLAALLSKGISSRLVVWTDEAISWHDADLIFVRSTWDYQDHLEEFLSWAKRCGTKLVHGAKVFVWNTSKSYLIDLGAAGVPIVPSIVVHSAAHLPQVPFKGPYVVKPLVGASGGGVQTIESLVDWQPPSTLPFMLQPFLPSIQEEGETTVFVIDGQVTGQLQKIPAQGQFLVHEEFGGKTTVVPISSEARALAELTVDRIKSLLGVDIAYARIDMMRYEGQLVLSEAELTEPSMSFDVIPGQVEAFAEMVLACCKRASSMSS